MALAALLAASPVQAQAPMQGISQCSPWPEMVRSLMDRYHEEPAAGGGLINPTMAIRVFVSPGGETFTIVSVGRDGRACILASGFGWDAGTVPGSGKPA